MGVQVEQIEWLVRIGFWLSLLFPLYIAPFWRWWDTWWGRNLISFDLSIALTLFPGWLHYAIGITTSDSVAWGWVIISGLYLVLINIIWRTAIIIYAQVTRYRNPEGNNESDNTSIRDSDPV